MKKIKLDKKQNDAVRSAFENYITVITGPAGSGKSTVCKLIVDIAQKVGQTVRLMTPTGKAAQVLSEKTGSPVSTIHRSLKLKKGSDELSDVVIREDIVIIDEVSMCGIDTFYPIMKAISQSSRTRLVLVGDKNQLPSVSPGNFLSDIIQSGCANVVSLDRIYRQGEKSFISLVANDISNGKVAYIPEDADDIKWHSINEATFDSDICNHINYLISEGFKMDDIQVIAPMKKGLFGIIGLNKTIQNMMIAVNRTESKYVVHGFNKFHLKDRVMQIENDYNKDVFNGDMGEIIELGEKVLDPTESDKKTKYIKVRFYDFEVQYVDSEIDELQLAWAITIHKYQGSQSPCVIAIMSNESQIMTTRELFYTGFTRASKRLDIFGHLNMFRMAPTRSSVKKRHTSMLKVVKQKRTGQEILKVRNSDLLGRTL